MFNRLTRGARAAVTGAEAEARALGAPSIEAEHLLLACIASGDPAFADAALDHETLLAAIEEDFEASLRSAGVSPELIATPAGPSRGKLRFGASSKSALENALKAAARGRDRRIETRHVALGVLQAKRGTVPRALRTSGIDHERLRSLLGSREGGA